MKALAEFLAEKREVTIHTLASYVRQYYREQAPRVLDERQEELLRLFEKAGDPAYGFFFRNLTQPLHEQLKQAGFVCEPDFPGQLSDSIEYWGPPEERERCMWSVVRTEQGEVLGTLVSQMFHDHTRFRIPHTPRVFVLHERDVQAIIEAISRAVVRLRGAQRVDVEEQEQPQSANGQEQPAWEYSVEVGLGDYLNSDRPELSEGMLDHALAAWGRHGWELVSVIPHQGRVIAFFRRPGRGR
jgi:hypothetical protein